MIGKWKLNDYKVWVPDYPQLFIKVSANNFKETLSFIRNRGDLYNYPEGCKALELINGCWTNETEKSYYPDNNFEDFKKKSLLIKELSEKYPIGTRVRTAASSSSDKFVYTISKHDFTIGDNNNIYVSTVEPGDGVALWMHNYYAEIVKDTKTEPMTNSDNFKVGDVVYLDRQYEDINECVNYSSKLKLNTPYTITYIGTVSIGAGDVTCIKLKEDNEYYQVASKFKLWSTKDVKSTDPFFDDALKAAKKVWPEFEWGCKMANTAGQTFTAIKPEEFTQYMKDHWFNFLGNTHNTFYIDPLNTYGKNYNISDLTVVSTKSAKERAEELMSSLPKSAAVKDQDIPEDVKKKLAERDKKEEFKHPDPQCQKYRIGDVVVYRSQECKIVNYTENYYIVEYSNGWSGSSNAYPLLLPGTLDSSKKYNYAKDIDLSKPANLKSTSSPDFKVGDWVTITKSNMYWALGMDAYVGKTVQIVSSSKNYITKIRFVGDNGWVWAYENGHFRAATAAEITQALYGSSIDNKTILFKLSGFKVGDKVKIVSSGSGIGKEDLGKIVTITELSANAYSGGPAARIAEPIGNRRGDYYDGWIGLKSFELYTPYEHGLDPYKRPDDFSLEDEYLKKPFPDLTEIKDSGLIELKQEPHTITESLAEPMLLRYNKSKSKLISI